MHNPFLPDNVTERMIDDGSTVTLSAGPVFDESGDRKTDAWCDYLNLLEDKKRNGVASAKELELLDRVAGRQKARA